MKGITDTVNMPPFTTACPSKILGRHSMTWQLNCLVWFDLILSNNNNSTIGILSIICQAKLVLFVKQKQENSDLFEHCLSNNNNRTIGILSTVCQTITIEQ